MFPENIDKNDVTYRHTENNDARATSYLQILQGNNTAFDDTAVTSLMMLPANIFKTGGTRSSRLKNGRGVILFQKLEFL